MRVVAHLYLALALHVAAPGDPPSVTPVPAPDAAKWTELKQQPNRLQVLAAQPASTWEPIDDLDLRTFEAGKYAAFVAPPGRYRVVVTAADGSRTRLVLVVGDVPPDPKPKPPDPPADPLRAKLKAAYDADASPKRQDQAKDLAALYREAAKLAADGTVATSGDLLARVRAASASLVGPDALKGVRQVAAAELVAVLPTDAPLSGDQRAAAAALFLKLAELLDGF